MIRIYQTNRKVDYETGEPSETTCMVVFGIGGRINKASFELTVSEGQELDDLTRDIERRIANELLIAPLTKAESKEPEDAKAETAAAVG
jgi:hypothetical protein